MLFAWIGYLKDKSRPIPPEVNRQTSAFLEQPYIRIMSVGPLFDSDGSRAAMLMLFEADSREAAEAFVANSPYQKAGLYERHALHEYRNEIG